MDQTSASDNLEAATRAEHDAYQTMRSLIPDLDLPASFRGRLSPRQEIAVSDYSYARERLRVTHALDGEESVFVRHW